MTSSQHQQPETLFVVAADSGGHILPALQLAKLWKEAKPDRTIVFITKDTPLEITLLKPYTWVDTVINVPLDKLSRTGWWKLPKILWQMLGVIRTSAKLLRRHQPEAVISTGGMLTIPIGIACKFTGYPLDIHELNVVPGKATTVLLPIARTIYTPFEKTKTLCKFFGINYQHKCKLHPYPIRFTQEDKVSVRTHSTTSQGDFAQGERFVKCPFALSEVSDQRTKSNGYERAQRPFSPTRKTIFILGGSQGSIYLNNLIKDFIEKNPPACQSIQIIHQTGPADKTDWQSFYAQHNIPAIVFSYYEQIKDYYLLADVVISRAGAGTLFELAFFEKKCIIIPLIAATTSHQVDNCIEMQRMYPKLFTVLDQEKIKASQNKLFYDTLVGVLQH